MSDRTDARMQALVVELASAAPLAPPMPDLETRRRRTPQGVGTAAFVFAGILVVALIAVVGGSLLFSKDQPVASSEIFTAAGATPVGVVTEDGETLRGYLWTGGPEAVAMVTAYGETTSDLISVALAVHRDGSTVLLVEPRGSGSSTGSAEAGSQPADMQAIVSDLATRGVEAVTVVGFRHSATAAIVMASNPPEPVTRVIAFFPFEQYQGLDAIGAVGSVQVPVTVVGASQPSELGPWAGNLMRTGGDMVSGTILGPLPTDALFAEFYRDDIVDIILTDT